MPWCISIRGNHEDLVFAPARGAIERSRHACALAGHKCAGGLLGLLPKPLLCPAESDARLAQGRMQLSKGRGGW
ncbi:hypothetical protein CBM2589_U20033 [Cupriavidus taiwanensis]|uniref:Uncharacterized protein n=1 Tax=Cupriavidus taiwanensis TaxID=164546 RepID=A0A375CRT6_9BURK|nr:hypothetical protein CBM2589_U20033 [Cupriavidus taiwanensis]